MNNKLTLAAVVLAHACVILGLTTFGGCKSTSGMEKPTDRAALRGSSSNFSSGFGGPGSSDTEAVSRSTVIQPAPVATTTAPANIQPPSPVVEPAGAPGTEPAPAPVATETAPAPTTPVSEEPKATGAGHTHIVRRNESLWIIAKREGISIDDLTAANNLKKNAILKEGQKLTIPAGAKKVSYGSSAPSHTKSETATAAASGDTYVVKSGDVLGGIARKLGTTTSALRAANNLKGDSIRIGQKLVIPAGAKSKPAATAKTGVAPAPVTKADAASGAKIAPAPVKAGTSALPDLQPYGAAPAPAPVSASPEAAPAPVSTESPVTEIK